MLSACVKSWLLVVVGAKKHAKRWVINFAGPALVFLSRQLAT
jgi:hypothetical protein